MFGSSKNCAYILCIVKRMKQSSDLRLSLDLTWSIIGTIKMNYIRILLFLLFMLVFSLFYYFGAVDTILNFDKHYPAPQNMNFENISKLHLDQKSNHNKSLPKSYQAKLDTRKSFRNNIVCQDMLNGELNISSYQEQPDFTSDDDVLLLAQQGCSGLINHYSFPIENYGTELELQNPIAFSFLVHTNVNQILLLLSALYATQNVYCIHVDLKSSEVLFEAIKVATSCFPNIILASKRENVVYASFSRLQADLNCMKDLISIPEIVYNWTALINLCGQDFPLKTNLEMVKQLVTLKGRSVINGMYNLIEPHIRKRTMFVHEIRKEKVKGGGFENKVIKTSKHKSPPPYQIPLRKNLAYNIYSRQFLRWVLLESKKAKALLEWSRDTATPDEHYWLMLASLPEAPGGLAKGMASHYIIFNSKNRSCKGYWHHYSCVFGAEDVSKMTYTTQLFANKFDIKYDALPVVCLRKRLDARRVQLNNASIANS